MKTALGSLPAGLFDERQRELYREVFEKLGAIDEASHSKFWGWFGRIGENYEYNFAEAQTAATAPALDKSRKGLVAAAKRYEKMAGLIDADERFERLYGTATDNLYSDPQIRENERRKHIERLHRRRVLKSLLREEAADCRERANSPNWRTEGGRSDNYSMARGDPVSSLFTDCCKMFEDFRPGKVTSTRYGDFQTVAGNIFELVTGLPAEPPHVSLEYRIDKAVRLHKKNITKKT